MQPNQQLTSQEMKEVIVLLIVTFISLGVFFWFYFQSTKPVVEEPIAEATTTKQPALAQPEISDEELDKIVQDDFDRVRGDQMKDAIVEDKKETQDMILTQTAPKPVEKKSVDEVAKKSTVKPQTPKPATPPAPKVEKSTAGATKKTTTTQPKDGDMRTVDGQKQIYVESAGMWAIYGEGDTVSIDSHIDGPWDSTPIADM